MRLVMRLELKKKRKEKKKKSKKERLWITNQFLDIFLYDTYFPNIDLCITNVGKNTIKSAAFNDFRSYH